MKDLIDRQALLEEYDRLHVGEPGRARKMIEDAPSVQPERKKGHWINVDDYYNRISGKCSTCGWESHLYEDDVVGMNFCPNCGADMRGVKQDE